MPRLLVPLRLFVVRFAACMVPVVVVPLASAFVDRITPTIAFILKDVCQSVPCDFAEAKRAVPRLWNPAVSRPHHYGFSCRFQCWG